MSEQHGLSFVSDGVIVGISVLLVAVTAVVCVMAWRRSGFRRSTGILETLRFVLLCLIVATFCQPEWMAEQTLEQRPVLAVLWDKSNSMKTRDVVEDTTAEREPRSRAETIEPLLTDSAWKQAEDNSTLEMDVVVEPFSSNLEPAEDGTDLNAGLTGVLEKHANLRGVVILSDGDWNVGKSPVEAAAKYRMKGVPVFAVAVGSKVPLPDLELASMDAPTFGIAGKPIRIPFSVSSTLGQDRDIRVTLNVNENATATQVLRVPAMSQSTSSITWTPPATGDYKLTMKVPKDAKELLVDNNAISAPIAIRQERLEVLVIESYPRWEYRYLRNALERDPGVKVSCLLFHPELPKVGGGRGYIKTFPTASELSRFDVVFVGDVGIGPKQLSEQQAQELRQLVSAQAAGLVFLPGRYGFQETLNISALADLLPVVVDPARTTGVGSSAPGHFALTSTGQRSLFTKLAETDQANADIWRTLPGFHWYAAVKRATPGSEVLAVHSQEATEAGRVPLLVTKTYGTGKVLFMGTDSAWKWREGVEDRYHYRFWGQVARWMAYQRQMADGQSMRLFYSPDRPRVDDVVSLNANVLSATGGPLNEGTVVVQAISPSGKTQTVRLQSGEEDAWGLFTGSLTATEPGNYRLVATCAETGASVQAELSVQGLNRERQGKLARFDVLEEITSMTNGRLVPVSDVQSLLDDLAVLPDPEPTMHRTRIWSHPAWCAALIVLMGVFWTGRKIIGAV